MKSAAAGSRAPTGRVRQFVERYGRVFGSGAVPESRSPDGEALPSNPELQALAAAEIDHSPARDTAAREDGMVILEANDRNPAPAALPTTTASDDIVFIE